MNPDSFEFDDVPKSCPLSNQTINQYGGTTCRTSFSRVNPDSTGCVWTVELDYATSRRESQEKKKLRFKNFQCGGRICGVLFIISGFHVTGSSV